MTGDSRFIVRDAAGKSVPATIKDDRLTFPVKAGMVYTVTGC
jgi:hypothetical protein